MILLDTHVAIWAADNDRRLGRRSRSMIESARAENELAISAISFWEIAFLDSKKRLKLKRPPAAMRLNFLGTGVVELPLTGDIALRAVDLESLPGDPADRFIAATAIVHGANLMTADDRLLAWRHALPRQNASQ